MPRCGIWPTISEDRRRLAEEPALIPIAVEEFLRADSPVTMARIAREDTTPVTAR